MKHIDLPNRCGAWCSKPSSPGDCGIWMRNPWMRNPWMRITRPGRWCAGLRWLSFVTN
jgi:hypothetical protein